MEKVIYKNTDRRKKIASTIAGAISFIIFFALGSWVAHQLFFKQPDFDETLIKVVSEMNKTTPVMLDEFTRFDSANALPGKTIQYNYTLVNDVQSEINYDNVKNLIEPYILENVRTKPELKIYRNHQTTFIYYYRDKDGIFVHKFTVTPDMYE